MLLLLGCPAARTSTGKTRGFELEKAPAWPQSADRLAVVIGVDDYHDPQITTLKGAVKDARRLSAALIKHAGLSEDRVFLMTSDPKGENEPTRAKILRRLSNIRAYARGKPNTLVLLAFAGHGIERSDRAFLLPSSGRYADAEHFLKDRASRFVHAAKQRTPKPGGDREQRREDDRPGKPPRTSGRAVR